jgi:hypothetical protein
MTSTARLGKRWMELTVETNAHGFSYNLQMDHLVSLKPVFVSKWFLWPPNQLKFCTHDLLHKHGENMKVLHFFDIFKFIVPRWILGQNLGLYLKKTYVTSCNNICSFCIMSPLGMTYVAVISCYLWNYRLPLWHCWVCCLLRLISSHSCGQKGTSLWSPRPGRNNAEYHRLSG